MAVNQRPFKIGVESGISYNDDQVCWEKMCFEHSNEEHEVPHGQLHARVAMQLILR